MTGRRLTVMTRNLYLGADVNRPVLAVLVAEPGHGGAALAEAIGQTRSVLDRTDFRVRARLVAAEIARTAPDLVGLQEVAHWHLTEGDLDFLTLLLDALTEAGVSYTPAEVAPRSAVSVPTAGMEVSMTLRDVVLVRAGAPEVLASGDAAFLDNLVLPLGGREITVLRGYQWVDVRYDGRPLRFVNTHLEAHDLAVACAQAGQLVGEAMGDGPVVVVGDLNSDPADPQRCEPYDLLLAAGLTDLAPGGPTYGFSEDLSDLDASGFDQRIDHVLGRGVVPVGAPELTGIGHRDRDPATGLWASDHAGVVVGIDLA